MTPAARRRRSCSPRSPASAPRPSGTSPARRSLRDVGHGRIVRVPVLAWPRMRREIQPGYELDDDRERIDVAAVHRFLSEEAYWALGRPFDTVALDRKSTRLNSSHMSISYAVFCLKKKKNT